MILIGVDGGGTKTDICLAGIDGTIVARRICGGTNPSGMGVGQAFGRLTAQITETADGADVHALYAGVAGAGDPATGAALREMLCAAFPAVSHIEVQSDAFNALNGEIGTGDGIAMIAGTGASAFVRKGGQVTQVGGWGYLIDDAGGGYALGQACLRAAFRAFDGRGAKTRMLDLVEEKLGMPVKSAVPHLYEGGASRVASFAPIAFRAARLGDELAARLVENCADEIARHIAVCRERYGAKGGACVLSGGMFREEALVRLVLQKTARMGLDIRRAVLPPVYGALVAAAELCGVCADDEFRANFTRNEVPA